MRIMRNELFSMCGLLAEAESDLKAAMERADELVRHVSTAIFGTAGANDDDDGKGENGAVTLRREEYGAFKLELGLVRQRLKRAVGTCQKCILAVEDDLDSISEQVRSPGRMCPPRSYPRRSDILGHTSPHDPQHLLSTGYVLRSHESQSAPIVLWSCVHVNASWNSSLSRAQV